MCFELYVGTDRPLPLKEWVQTSPALSVALLSPELEGIKTHFSKHSVQYIGSTSCCGCDFPHLMLQGEDWPSPLEKDPERAASDHLNQDALVTTLQESGEKFVELYGIWNGDISEPKARQEIRLQDLLDPNFYFKEQGFYRVNL